MKNDAPPCVCGAGWRMLILLTEYMRMPSDTLCVAMGNPYIPSDCQLGSLVERFSSNDKNKTWMINGLQPAFPASPCARDLMIPKMLWQDIKRKESMGTTAISWSWSSSSSSSASWHRKRHILNRINMGCDDMKNQFFHLKESSMEMLFPSLCNEFLHLCHQNK